MSGSYADIWPDLAGYAAQLSLFPCLVSFIALLIISIGVGESKNHYSLAVAIPADYRGTVNRQQADSSQTSQGRLEDRLRLDEHSLGLADRFDCDHSACVSNG